ncbi:cell wall-binding repeat-containing protein [Ornithinibacillus salinisoli]|uniref:Cell wall-binding repeat-containing protein n=1 Tax=Ornithinibacillus salinisoli TaxID=1848459 RepID=A0ABW4W0Y7_9BACI
MFHYCPKTDISLVRKLLHQNGTDLGEVGRDTYFGFGLIQSSNGIFLHGSNRYETSIVIAQPGLPSEVENVVLGRGDLLVDALTGALLAKKYISPLLVTKSSVSPEVVGQEMERLKPTNIVIIGGMCDF